MPVFEVFTGRAYPAGEEEVITIHRRGLLSVNRAAHIALGEPEAVELLYDWNERVMGLRAVSPEVQHAYPVRRQRATSSLLVSGRAFTTCYGIPTETARRYQARMLGDVLAEHISVIDDRVEQWREFAQEACWVAGRSRHHASERYPETVACADICSRNSCA